MEWLAVKGAFGLVPRWLWSALGGLLLAVLVGWYALDKLHDRDAANYERGRSDYAAEMEAAAKPIIAEQGQVTERVVTKYVDRIVKVQGVTRTILKEVPVYVPASAPDLPAGFRVLHDAAAAGAVPDPAAVADAAPVAAQAAAGTVADNYGTCHETEQRLISLQDWVAQQREANP